MAGYKKYQIVLVPQSVIQVGKRTYPGYFLIYEVTKSAMYMLAISTRIDTFFDESRDFLIDSTEDGFTTTGLKETSFVKNLDFRAEPSMKFKIIGSLSGELLQRFKDFEKRFDLA